MEIIFIPSITFAEFNRFVWHLSEHRRSAAMWQETAWDTNVVKRPPHFRCTGWKWRREKCVYIGDSVLLFIYKYTQTTAGSLLGFAVRCFGEPFVVSFRRLAISIFIVFVRVRLKWLNVCVFVWSKIYICIHSQDKHGEGYTRTLRVLDRLMSTLTMIRRITSWAEGGVSRDRTSETVIDSCLYTLQGSSTHTLTCICMCFYVYRKKGWNINTSYARLFLFILAFINRISIKTPFTCW